MMSGTRDHRVIRAADQYAPPKDLTVVSTFFNSEGYRSKVRALRAFRKSLEASGIPFLLVEGAFGDSPFLLPSSKSVIHVRCASVMWQKERLLNHGIRSLPGSCRKVAWLDTDIFFENAHWAVETSELLDQVPIVQPFDVALWLPKGTTRFQGSGIAWPGFAAVAQHHPGLFLSGDFDRHGHSGYAWAARRDVIERHGLYDLSVAGSGDHLMAHAMFGDLSSPCVTNSVGADNSFRDSFHAWAGPFFREVRSRVGFVRGAVLHRWHGDRKKRRYYKRMIGILARGYDPTLDVKVSSSGALQWTEHGRPLARWMKGYFSGRDEDGTPEPSAKVPWTLVEQIRKDSPGPLDDALRPFSKDLGVLATLVAARSDLWTTAGLVPVLPNLLGYLILDPPTTRIDPAGLLSRILERANQSKRNLGAKWDELSPETRWATVVGTQAYLQETVSGSLSARIRDPRWREAPELENARKVMSGVSRNRSTHPNPFDSVVGPGSLAAGLEHV